RRGGALDVQLIAVAPDQQHRPHRFDRARAANRYRQWVFQRFAGLLVEGTEDLLDRPPHRILEPPARELLGYGVDVIDGRERIGRDDPIADRLQRDLGALLLAKQRLLVQLALGDVELDADQAQQPAVRIELRLGATDDPAPFAAAMAHAVDAFEYRGLAGHVLANRRLHTRGIVRMHEAAPVEAALQIGLIVAEHRAPARREVDVIALNVEVPQAVVGSQFGQGIALLDAAQCQRQAHALQSGRKTGAEQLHEQLQVDVEAATRQSIGEPEKARRLILDAKRHQQRRPDRKFGQRAGVVGLLLAREGGIEKLGKLQVLAARAQPQQRFDGDTAQRLGMALREVTAGEHYRLDMLGVLIEEDREGGIG